VFPLTPAAAVEFDRVPVVAFTSDGTPYRRWATTGMPKLGEYQYLLDAVFFLYPDEASAKAGVAAGGTGFFVSIPSTTYPDQYHYHYAVTNWHVACGYRDKPPNPVFRVNAGSGAPKVFDHDVDEWRFIGGHHDIAVLPVDLRQDLKVESIDINSFALTEREITEKEINAGEDVFMLGRFIDYDGIEENCPSMRFGNISMMKANQIQPTGCKEPSIVVDMHSRTGYSGSPVFVYRTHGSIFAKDKSFVFGGHMMKLLGILWGQFPEQWDLKIGGAGPVAKVPNVSVEGMSGMSLVCPASAIVKVLNMKKLKDQRAAIDARLHEVFSGAAVPQSGPPPFGRNEEG
jgi:hypothetical protein